MAIVWIREQYDGRPSDHGIDAQRNHTRQFLVLVDDEEDNGATILADAQTPQILSNHGDDNALLVRRSIRPHADSPGELWVLTCTYSTDLGRAVANATSGEGGEQSGNQDENPHLRPPELEFETVRYQTVVETDWDGFRVRNMAGDAFDPPITEDEGYLSLTVERNVAQFLPANLAPYAYAMNSVPYLGFNAEEVFCDMLSAKPHFERIFYWRLKARFLFSPLVEIPSGDGTATMTTIMPNGMLLSNSVRQGGWRRRILNAGFMEKISGGSRRRITRNGQPVSKPWPLKENGLAFTDAQLSDPAENPPVYIEFRSKKSADFNALGLFS